MLCFASPCQMNIAGGYNNMAISAFYRRDYDECWQQHVERCLPYLPGCPGTWNWITAHFFGPLALMQLCEETAQVGHLDASMRARAGRLSFHAVPAPTTFWRRRCLRFLLTSRWRGNKRTHTYRTGEADDHGLFLFAAVMTRVQESIALLETWATLAKAQLPAQTGPRARRAAAMSHLSTIVLKGTRRSFPRRRLEYVLPALRLYDAAIAGARSHSYVQDEMLANELAAEFCLLLERHREAAHYMRAAYSCAVRWGCILKQTQLRRLYLSLLHFSTPRQQQQARSVHSSLRHVPCLRFRSRPRHPGKAR